jgi:GNAT superfamily N-acetyltransferase
MPPVRACLPKPSRHDGLSARLSYRHRLDGWPTVSSRLMHVTVRAARAGDGVSIDRLWLSAAAYYADLDPEHFQLPAADGLGDSWDNDVSEASDDSLRLVAEFDGQVVGWLTARIEQPSPRADRQLVRELSWRRLVIDALVVHRDQWRQGAGTALLEAAEDWGRSSGARVVRLDTYAHSSVSVPFYEEHMGYERRSIVFQKWL